jgi:cytochrome c-type biogenesis protein CcmF
MGKISVGPPYFNSVFIPLTAPLAVLVGIGAIARWKRENLLGVVVRLRIPLIASLLVGAAFPIAVMGEFAWPAVLGMILAFWVTLSTLYGLYERVGKKDRPLQALLSTPRAFYGMSLAHLGVAVFIVGVVLTTSYGVEKDVGLAPGETQEIEGYTFRFEGVRRVPGPNYEAERGLVVVSKGGREIAQLEPEKRIYRVQQNPMTEAAIDAGLFRDLYVAIGEPIGDGAWALRIYYKPFIRWIWLGAFLMGLGGFIGATDKRYRMARRLARDQATEPSGGQAGKGGAVAGEAR